MNKIGYEYKCKNCAYSLGRQDDPNFSNQPAACPKCKGDMGVEPVFEDSNQGLTYELWINNKISGVSLQGSISLSLEETNNPKVMDIVVKKLSGEFARVIMNEDNRKKLLLR